MFFGGLDWNNKIAPCNINLEMGGEVSTLNQILTLDSKNQILEEKKLPLGVFARFSR